MPKTYQIIDKRGRVVARDENEDAPLRDGESLRVPMWAMDGFQRAVVNDARRKKVVERDRLGRLKANYEEEEFVESERDRKGSAMQIADDATFTDSRGVTFTDTRIVDTRRAVERLQAQQAALQAIYRDGRAAAEQARREAMADTANAWRGDAAPAGAYPYRTAAEGTPCTVNGRPGTLVREGNYLVCKPTASQDARPVFDAIEGARRKREAYEAMCHDMANAWKGGK